MILLKDHSQSPSHLLLQLSFNLRGAQWHNFHYLCCHWLHKKQNIHEKRTKTYHNYNFIICKCMSYMSYNFTIYYSWFTMFSGILSQFLKISFLLSIYFYSNPNNRIIFVFSGIISPLPCFALSVCFHSLVCFIWISEITLRSLPYPKKYGQQKGWVAYSSYPCYDSCFAHPF